jgi:hypothetical protein
MGSTFPPEDYEEITVAGSVFANSTTCLEWEKAQLSRFNFLER